MATIAAERSVTAGGVGWLTRTQLRVRPQVSLVIPAHNEETVIAQTLLEYSNFLQDSGLSHEILVILNGCCDRTLEEVEALRADHPAIGYMVLPKAGKGYALREGLALAQGELVSFVDADGQIAPQEFKKLLEHLERHQNLDGVIGTKYQDPSSSLSWQRRLTGQCFNKLTRWILGLPFSDTQCGAKVFRHQALREILRSLRLDGWAFDVELLLRLYRWGSVVEEIPIRVKPAARCSRISFLQVAPPMFRDALRLWLSRT